MKIPDYYIFKTVVNDMKTKIEVELQSITLEELLDEIFEASISAEESETYIIRSDAIKVLAEYLMYDATTESEDASVDIEDWEELAEDILKDVPLVKPTRKKAEWISVNERLPKINETGFVDSGASNKLLLCWSDGQIVIGYYVGDNTFIGHPWPQAADATVTVTAWMYAPEPYVGV